MKYPKMVCSVIMLIVLLTPLVSFTMKPVKGIEFTANWDYTGMITKQTYRSKMVPDYVNETEISVAFDALRMRTFIFILDDPLDDDTEPDSIVVLHGIGPIRNAPLYSYFFEEPGIAGEQYSFNVSRDSDVDWIDIDPDSAIINPIEPVYNAEYHLIYERVKFKTIAFSELYTNGTDLKYTVHLANFISETGVVGHWQKLYKDKTVVNGNFTTFGADNPLFIGPPHDPFPEEQWWPQFNITIAQNVERTSLPGTHSLAVNYPFLSVISTFTIGLIIVFSAKRRRRNKK